MPSSFDDDNTCSIASAEVAVMVPNTMVAIGVGTGISVTGVVLLTCITLTEVPPLFCANPATPTFCADGIADVDVGGQLGG